VSKASALEARGSGLVLRNLVVENYSLKPKIRRHALPDRRCSARARIGSLHRRCPDQHVWQPPWWRPVSLHVQQHLRLHDSAEHRELPLSGRSDRRHLHDQPQRSGGCGVRGNLLQLSSGARRLRDAHSRHVYRRLNQHSHGQGSLGWRAFTSPTGPSAGVLVSATQSGNVFDADTIVATAPTNSMAAAASGRRRSSLTSSDDRLSRMPYPRRRAPVPPVRARGWA